MRGLGAAPFAHTVGRKGCFFYEICVPERARGPACAARWNLAARWGLRSPCCSQPPPGVTSLSAAASAATRCACTSSPTAIRPRTSCKNWPCATRCWRPSPPSRRKPGTGTRLWPPFPRALPWLQAEARSAAGGQPVQVRLTESDFPGPGLRRFPACLPGAMPRCALELGQAEGHNWFCVLYPAPVRGGKQRRLWRRSRKRTRVRPVRTALGPARFSVRAVLNVSDPRPLKGGLYAHLTSRPLRQRKIQPPEARTQGPCRGRAAQHPRRAGTVHLLHRRRALPYAGRYAVGYVESYSFTSLAETLLRRYGGAAVPTLTEAGRAVLVRRALDQLLDQVSYYSRQRQSAAFCRKAAETIEELQKRRRPPRRTRALCPRPRGRYRQAQRAGPDLRRI